MKFTVLSHAGLYVEADGISLLIDPWLVGSCYWRSWWNYPSVSPELIDSLKPDFIYITHIHWDHFHGVSLKRFAKDTKIFIPYDRYDRMWRDLLQLGFTRVERLPHGKTVRLSDNFEITPYLFFPFTDSALVMEAEGHTLLNANDSKFAGLPLKQVLKRHGQFDFAFRSHSSANTRACYHLRDAPEQAMDDSSGYASAFCEFMASVKPRYAIPFASNHCHMHQDVFDFNDAVQTPHIVKRVFEARFTEKNDPKIAVMVSGDSWDADHGFDVSDKDWFTDRVEYLKAYQLRLSDKLEVVYEKERKVRVTLGLVEKFFLPFLCSVPWVLRKRFQGQSILLRIKGGEGLQCYRVDVFGRSVKECVADAVGDMEIEYPSVVFRQCLVMNMFAHAGISKRLRFIADTSNVRLLNRFQYLLMMYEYEMLPLRRLFSWQTMKVYARRWRELVFYVQVGVDLIRGMPEQEIEKKYLRLAQVYQK